MVLIRLMLAALEAAANEQTTIRKRQHPKTKLGLGRNLASRLVAPLKGLADVVGDQPGKNFLEVFVNDGPSSRPHSRRTRLPVWFTKYPQICKEHLHPTRKR